MNQPNANYTSGLNPYQQPMISRSTASYNQSYPPQMGIHQLQPNINSIQAGMGHLAPQPQPYHLDHHHHPQQHQQQQMQPHHSHLPAAYNSSNGPSYANPITNPVSSSSSSNASYDSYKRQHRNRSECRKNKILQY